MSKEEFLKIQTCVLKVNIHCDGCKHKVKKILQKIDGVFKTHIDSEQGKVTISGNVDPEVLIKKLAKSGKHAELWGAPKGNVNLNPTHMGNPFKNMQIENGKGGNNKSKGNPNPNQKPGPNPNQQGGHQLTPQQIQQLQQLNAMKDFGKLQAQFMDMKMPGNPNPNQKAVKYADPDDDEFSEDDFDDDGDFTDEDDFSDDELDGPPVNKMKMMGMNGGMQQQILAAQKAAAVAAAGNGKKGGGGGGNGAVPVQVNMGGGNGNGGKKGGGGGNQNPAGKNAGNVGGGGNKGGNGGGGNGNNMQMGGGKKGGPGGGMGGNMGMPMGQMGGNMGMPMGQMGGGGMPMGQMGNMPAVQGLPPAAAMGGGGGANGYFPGPGPDMMAGNPYPNPSEQQQYLQTVMNQQRAMGNERFQPMMYARPPPAVNYAPPYPYPYPYPYPPQYPGSDPYTNFSDENTSSCNVM